MLATSTARDWLNYVAQANMKKHTSIGAKLQIQIHRYRYIHSCAQKGENGKQTRATLPALVERWLCKNSSGGVRAGVRKGEAPAKEEIIITKYKAGTWDTLAARQGSWEEQQAGAKDRQERNASLVSWLHLQVVALRVRWGDGNDGCKQEGCKNYSEILEERLSEF